MEEELKSLIIKEYGNLKNFASILEIPYSTIDTIFKRGLMKANIANIIAICNELKISIDALVANRIEYTYQRDKLTLKFSNPISNTVNHVTIGDRIKQRRMELGYSVDQLAEMIGKNRATIYRYENNSIESLPANILPPLAKALKTTHVELMVIDIIKKYNISYRLKQIMSDRNLKQVDILNLCDPFCKKYNIRLAKNDLSQYVSGRCDPGQDKLTVLGWALNVNEVWLMGYDVPQERNALPTIETTNDQPLSSMEHTHLSNLNKLNDIGKEKVYAYAQDLVASKNYELLL